MSLHSLVAQPVERAAVNRNVASSSLAQGAIKGERTLNEIATDYKVHPNQIPKWKKRAIEFVASGFSGELTARAEDDSHIKDQLYQQIGQLKVELDWLKKKSGLWS